MSGKFMKVKRVLISTLTIVLIASQLVGCGAGSQKELLDMMKNQQAICIEIPIPKDELSYKDIEYEWQILALLQTYPEFREKFDDIMGITAFGENGKNGVAYVDLDGYHTDNSILMYAYNNNKFIEYINDSDNFKELKKAVLKTYKDLDEKSADRLIKVAIINAYFNILPDISVGEFNGSDALTRMEYLAAVYRACQPVKDLEKHEDLAAYVDPEYENEDTIFALQMMDLSYFTIDEGDLNDKTYNTGSMSRAEAIYTLVQMFYADEYEKVDVKKDKAYKDTKNGGNLAEKYKFEGGYCPKLFTLYKALEDNKLPEDLYKAMVVAKRHGIIKGDESKWNEAVTKADTIEMLLNVFTDLGADLYLERGDKSPQEEKDEFWKNMESSQPYFQLGSEHLNRKQAIPGWYEYTYDEAFIGTLYMIQGGWFNGASAEDLSQILNTALNNLPDNASSKEVYDALVDFASKYPHDRWVTGVGNSPMGEEHNTPQPKPNNNSNGNSNNNSNSNNNNSNSGNKKPSNNTGNNNSGNNNSNNNNSSSNNNDSGATSGFGDWGDSNISDDTDWDEKYEGDLDMKAP